MKNAIITGGATGIGAAIVEMLAMQKYNVLFTYNKSKTEANELLEKLNEYNIEAIQADVSNIEEVNKLTTYAIDKYKTIDVLINNAGIDEIKLILDTNLEDWNNIINTNLRAPFFISKEISKNMVQNKCGLIINISSIWGMVGASCETLYSISKAGLDGLTKSLAKELAPSNIRVNSIAPGAIDTKMNKNISKEEWQQIKEEIPLGRIGKPEDIAKCVKWLIEDEYTTGQIISPNGGWII